MLGTILASIFGYLIGSVLFAVLIVKFVSGKNVYEYGSANPGATNTLRILGKRWGATVSFCDGLKVIITAFFAVALSMIDSPLFNNTSYFIPCIFTIIGHCFPIWFKFKGGKGVSCFLGLLIVVNFLLFIIFYLLWWITAFIWRRVSVSSMIGAISILILMWLPWLYGVCAYGDAWNGFELFKPAWEQGLIFSFNALHKLSPHEFADSLLTGQLMILIGIIILFIRHKTNIERLTHHNEPQTLPKMNKDKKQEIYKEQRNLIEKHKQEKHKNHTRK